jgi:hypothetical protein
VAGGGGEGVVARATVQQFLGQKNTYWYVTDTGLLLIRQIYFRISRV